jgi:hypothetical protein
METSFGNQLREFRDYFRPLSPPAVTKPGSPANYKRYASMTTRETDLKALMLASLDGDAASHRALLDQLSRRLRAYYGKAGWTGHIRGSGPVRHL